MRAFSIILLPPLLLAASCAARSDSALDPSAAGECCNKAPRPAEASASALPDDSLFQFASPWQTDDDRTVKLADFRGHPLVVAMIFTHCQYACPLIVNDIKRLDAALTDDLRGRTRFVLVTFDLKRDTPRVLREFRARSGLTDDPRWTLLRAAGEDDTLELAALLNVKYKADASGQFSHTNLISILDTRGRLVHQQVGLNAEVGQTAAVMQKLPK